MTAAPTARLGQVAGDDAFIAALHRLRDHEDRGSLAALRRGLGAAPGSVSDMHPLVAPHAAGRPRAVADAMYTLAALFAMHPKSGGRGSLGAALARVSRARGGAPGVERRLTRLLDAHREDLPALLRQAVALCRTEDIPVDWGQLLRDIGPAWDYEGRPVQRRWANDFWGPGSAGAHAEAAERDDENPEIGA